ncbi:MAG: hypothetical protein GQ534_11795 [Candidatus Delongbacteria bacterium]|nr:hypothetical protein [Candidatus Delongbacteria bacterium]
MSIYGFYIFLYLLISIIFAVYIVFKENPSKKIISFSVVFWLLTFNMYKSRMVIGSVPGIRYVKKADELLGYLFLALLTLVFVSSSRKTSSLSKKPLYEKYLVGYLGLTIVLHGVHSYLGNIQSYKAFIFARLTLSALLIFWGVRKFISKELIKALLKSVVFIGIATSFLSVIQFFIDTKVVRIGAFHSAFMGFHRSSGIFMQPYDNGLFLILAIYTALYIIRDRKLKIMLVAFFALGMILTFTRGIWISFILVTVFHLYYYYKHTFQKYLAIFSIVFFLGTLTMGTYIIQKDLFSNTAFTDRVFADTVTIRIVFYKFIIEALPDAWLIGYGDVVDNEVYFQGMVDSNQGLYWAMGRQGSIHNMFLEVAFLQGIFASIVFTMMFIYFFRYNVRESIKHKSFVYCLPNYYVMGFFFYFFSVAGFLLSRRGFLSIFMFAIISGIKHNNIDVSGITIPMNAENLRIPKNRTSDETKVKDKR